MIRCYVRELSVFVLAVVLCGVGLTHAQSFSSGSNGSDGPLNLTAEGTYVFDPDNVTTFGKVLDPDRDNIYHFTTINIAAGVTLKLSAQKGNGPMFWLAQGAVTIAGTMDLNGDKGNDASSNSRYPAVPGPGGFGGGVGGPAGPGFGPGGGAAGGTFGQCSDMGEGGTFSGNAFLVPLIGGSGGGGSTTGAGGGAGGGAILIASSMSIAISGAITAVGGESGFCTSCFGAGRGSGGAIRLAALSISGSGQLNAAGTSGNAGCNSRTNSGGTGRVRIEAFQDTFTGPITGNVTRATPFNTFTSDLPSVRVVSVAGVPVSPSPTGSLAMPDVTINSSVAVPFAIEARNIPVGTVVKLQIFSENASDLTVNASPLVGTLQLSTATANVLLPSGFSRGVIRAIWTQ